MTTLFEEFMNKRFPNEPRDSSYWNEWKERFLKGPEEYMDSISLKIYKELMK